MPLVRLVVAAAIALAVAGSAPARVAACSCAVGEPGVQIREAQLAFIGTVVDRQETGAQTPIGMPLIEYAFDVERASAPTDRITVVSAGEGDASCGITFGVGETWLVIVPPPTDMGDTHLCAGNIRLADIGADERAGIEAMLPVVPASGQPAEESESVPPAVLLGGGAVVAVVGIGVFAFRRGRVAS